MKKLLTMALAIVMLASLHINAYAVTNNGTQATGIEVTGTYVEGSDPGTVISADISWEDMTFTYTVSEQRVWNPKTHQYDTPTESGWTVKSKSITVTNHSNTAILASFAFQKADGVDTDVTGSFSRDSLEVSSAVGTAVGAAPQASTTFSITGGSITEDTTLGTIQITIAAN